MFIALRVAFLLCQKNTESSIIPEVVSRRFVGAITSLAWFSLKPEIAMGFLYKQIEVKEPLGFLSNGSFRQCYTLDRMELPQIPPVKPSKLKEIITAVTLEKHGYNTRTNGVWTKWQWEASLQWLSAENVDCTKWYNSILRNSWNSESVDMTEGHEEPSLEEVEKCFDSAWTQFIYRIRNLRPLLFYCQRQGFDNLFPGFDSTSLNHLDERERPWDFDHIHPSAAVKGKRRIPNLIKEIHDSIGNLRIWPFELNRSDADAAPAKKLQGNFEGEDIAKLSFMGKRADVTKWVNSMPEGLPANYLAIDKHFEEQKALVSAILNRLCAIYSEWFNELEIESLLKGDKESAMAQNLDLAEAS
jgi:hypothetical protein